MSTSDPTAPTLQQVELPEGTLSYRAAGPADSAFPKVVFVHGLLVDHGLWTGVADILASWGIRSFAPDWPLGSHRIPMNPDADLSPRAMPAIINGFLDTLGLSDVTLVGNDTGGALCQFTIDADHSRIGRLVLTNCDAFDVFPPAEFAGLTVVGRHAALLTVMAGLLQLPAVRHSGRVYGDVFADRPSSRVTRGWVEPLLRDRAVRRDAAKVLGAIDAQELLDVSTRLGAFDKPVRLVWGADDPFFSIEFAERLAAVFPDATLTPVPGGRTFLPMDFPEQVAGVIRDAQPATRTDVP